MKRVFLDASVLVAAVASREGGSALVVRAAQKGFFDPVVSRLVLLEAERNVRKKLPHSALERFHQVLEGTPLHVTPAPTPEEIRLHERFIHEKDAPILAAAAAGRCVYLVTLDRRHFMTEKLRGTDLPLKILTPGDFLREILFKSQPRA